MIDILKNKGRFKLFSLVFIAIVVGACNQFGENNNPVSKEVDSTGWNYVEIILSKINQPEFKNSSYNIIDFGAVADGITDCTEAIKGAIKKCNEQGGGKVLVPEGTFITGAIHLLSNVNLFVDKGAVLKFTKDKTKYLPVVHTRFEGMECMNYSPFIYAYKQENIAITGKGTIDGQGEAWWSWKGPWDGLKEHGWKKGMANQLKDNAELLKMVETDQPLEMRIFGGGHFLRPNFIQPNRCKNILIEGVKIINSPMWAIHPVLSENITVRGVRIESLGPNNDGCNPESSKNILIKDCYFNTGDDCIAIKSGRNNEGRKFNVPSENIVVQNCVMKDGHGGIVIGSEISGNVKNVFAENCTLDSPHLDRALRIKSNSVRGGLVENIYFRNSEIFQVAEAVVKVNMFYDEDRDNYIPSVRNIHVENIISHKSKYAVWVKSYKSKPLEGLSIKNSKFENVKMGVFLENVENIKFENVDILSIE